MFLRYALIGRSLRVFHGRLSVLGGFVFGFALLAWAALTFILAGESAAVRHAPLWAHAVAGIAFALALTRLAARLLYRPLPRAVLPASAHPHLREGLWTAFLAGLRFRELNGCGYGGLFDPAAPSAAREVGP